MKASRMAQALFPAVALAIVSGPGCGGSKSPVSSAEVPDVQGTYAGSVAWTTAMTSSQGSEVRSYGGRVTVDNQTDSAFSGTFSIEGAGSGPITRGMVESNGAVSFELPDPAGGPHPGPESWSETCTLMFDSVVYQGRVDGAALEAARSLRYSCPKAGAVSVSVIFSGRK